MSETSSALPYVITKYSELGFDKDQIKKAWEKANSDETKLLDILFANNQVTSEDQTKKEQGLATRIMQAFQPKDASKSPDSRINYRADDSYNTNEYLNPIHKRRTHGIPVGLQNVGNTCYVNSLLQTYFISQKFVSAILNYDPDVTVVGQVRGTVLSGYDVQSKTQRIQVENTFLKYLVKSLQKLFALMLKGPLKYLDPTEVIRNVMDDNGNAVGLGDQRDITEYHLNFLSRVEEAFISQDKYIKVKENIMLCSKNSSEEDQLDGLVPADRSASESPEASNDEISRQRLDSVSLVHHPNLLMKNHFFGRMKEHKTFIQDGKEHEVEGIDFGFGPLILDVSNNKELYEGLDKYFNYTIDDFRAPNGKKVNARGDLWIVRPSEFLVVQLNRVSYSQVDGLAYKLNTEFQFEKEIYLDRFMLENREEATKLSQKTKILRDELEQKEKKLQTLMNYPGSSFSVPEVLDKAESFISIHAALESNQDQEQTESSNLAAESPDGDKCNAEEVQTALKVLRQYRRSIENQISELTINILEIKKEIKKLHTCLNKHKYHLAAIIIHSGVAGQGHYYSFNRNIDNGTWSRFNDMNVTLELESTVMREAVGGHGNTSAYCLVYISHTVVQEDIRASSINYTNAKNLEEAIAQGHHNTEKIPAHLEDFVRARNFTFQAKIEKFQFESNLSYAIRVYQSRFDVVTRKSHMEDWNRFPARFDSFSIFMKADSQNERLLKWYLLDSTIRESKICSSLRDLNDPTKLALIEDKLSLYPKPYTFKNLLLSKEEKAELDLKLLEYMEALPIVSCYKFVVQSVMCDNWIDVCYGVRRILHMDKAYKSCSSKLIYGIVRVTCLKLALKIERLLTRNKLSEVRSLCQYLIALVKGVLNADDIPTKQIRAILSDGLDRAEPYTSKEDFNNLRQEVNGFYNASYRIATLEKVIKDYKCEILEALIDTLSLEDNYSWKDIENQSRSYEFSKVMKTFSRASSTYVDFHFKLSKRKRIYNLEERREQNFILS